MAGLSRLLRTLAPCRVFCGHAQVDYEQVKRLFDPDRDPEERVRGDDWFAGPSDPEWRALYAHETVGGRRRWYMNLMMSGEL